MWLDILALIGAIWLIVRVVVLRQVAALPFTRQAARFVDAAAPAAIADLVAQANAELDELGFEPARWVRVVDADGEQARLRIVRLHRKCHAAVWLEAPTLFAPNRLLVWYVTRMLDGRTLITQPFDVYFQLLAREQALVQICGEASFAGQWAAHCALVATHGATDAAGIEDAALLGFYIARVPSGLSGPPGTTSGSGSPFSRCSALIEAGGVQVGLYLTAFMNTDSSGVGRLGRPTTTLELSAS